MLCIDWLPAFTWWKRAHTKIGGRPRKKMKGQTTRYEKITNGLNEYNDINRMKNKNETKKKNKKISTRFSFHLSYFKLDLRHATFL